MTTVLVQARLFTTLTFRSTLLTVSWYIVQNTWILFPIDIHLSHIQCNLIVCYERHHLIYRYKSGIFQQKHTKHTIGIVFMFIHSTRIGKSIERRPNARFSSTFNNTLCENVTQLWTIIKRINYKHGLCS